MAKCEVSVRIDSALLAQVDQRLGARTQSEVFEEALRQWLDVTRREKLERDVGAYYSDRLALADDREWAEFSAGQMGKTWR